MIETIEGGGRMPVVTGLDRDEPATPAGAGHLLVVDDDDIIRSMLRLYLQRYGFAITDVADGTQAQLALQSCRFDLILLDTMLPDMSGLEVLARLRRTYSTTDLPIIMATARGRTSDVVEALHLGANDYLTKPFDLAVALARIQTQIALKRSVERIRRLEQSLAQRNAELEAANAGLAQANQHMKQDLEAASRVQSLLLPDKNLMLPGVRFAWQFQPCAELAGDLLNVMPIDDQHVGLCVMDVVGHGVKAALLAVMISRVLGQLLAARGAVTRSRGPHRAEGPQGKESLAPAAVVAYLNRAFPWDERTDQFCTLLYGDLDLAERTFTFICAGHPGPLYLPRSGPAQQLDTPGAPVGVGAGNYQERTVTLTDGDRLYLHSDGVLEARSPAGECFGRDRLLHLFQQERSARLEAGLARLLNEVQAWCGPVPPNDDISILAFELMKEE
jgi:sigma-B regulation protein RsbU (phosphoserine phosphatase)